MLSAAASPGRAPHRESAAATPRTACPGRRGRRSHGLRTRRRPSRAAAGWWPATASWPGASVRSPPALSGLPFRERGGAQFQTRNNERIGTLVVNDRPQMLGPVSAAYLAGIDSQAERYFGRHNGAKQNRVALQAGGL